MMWDFACPDWEQRLRDGRSLIPDLPLDDALVRKSVGIFNKLRLPDVAGTPTLADAAGDWWRDIIAAIFGSLDDAGVRRVRKVMCMVPKKNSKTTNAAATAITALLMDPVPRQRYSLYGPTQEIAERGFNQAVGMIEADPEGVLMARFHVRADKKIIRDRQTKSELKVITFDEKVATGGIEKGVIVDELHILGKSAAAARVLGQIQGGMLPRPDAFMLLITTQSDKQPAGVFKQELALARGVRDGRVTGEGARVLPVLYEMPEAMQRGKDQPWSDKANWPMVLPNLGRPFTIADLSAEWEEAKAKGLEEQQRWASQHLNVEIGLALQDGRWIGADYWEGAAFEPLRDLDALLARAEVAVIGIDGGGLDDLTGVCVLGRDRKTKVWLYWFHVWAHRKVLQLRKSDIAPRLIDFETDKDLTFWGDPHVKADVAKRLSEDEEEIEFLQRPRQERNEVDEDVRGIVAVCEKVRDSGLLPEEDGIGADPAAIGALLDALVGADFTLRSEGQKGDVTSVSQGVINMFSAINTLQRKLEGGTAAHGGTALMDWCVSNAKAEQRGNSVAITKQQAGKAKIDPLVAAFVATKLMERNPEAAGRSVYETRGLLTV